MEAKMRALRVLVVEDDEDTITSLTMLLRLYGYEVEVAADGPTALWVVGLWQPDVVLLDIRLPKMNGWVVAKQIRELRTEKGPFLIAITGYGMEADRVRSQEAGIDLHLVKPVDADVLNSVLKRFQAVVMPSQNEHAGVPKPKRLVFRVTHRIMSLLKDENGPTAVEYSVMLALIIAVCVGAITAIGSNTNATFTSAGNAVNVASS
jgi:CheY-like chemotaxis protein